jgi:hypothetical protein
MSLTKASYSMITGASINVLDYGAVADAVVSGNNVVSGTDNLAAFQAAFTKATASGITRVRAPGGFYYISAPFTLPRGVTLEGDGTSHLPIVTQSSNRTGTCLLINGTAGADCLAFESNAGHSGLANISIYNTNTNAIRSVVSIVGQLYPRMTNVELASLKRTTGTGLWLSPAQSGAQYETLWGAFHNVIVTITDVGSANEASVRYGVTIYGNSSTSICNANSFVSGQFAGAWAGLLIDGATATSGASSCVFHGVKFDTNWDGTYAPQFRAAANGVFGWIQNNCYIYPVVHIKSGRDIAFHGCYFEAAGSPATYNDGVNGTYTLLATFMNDGGTTANKGTDIIGCNWNGCYLYDIAQAARVDPIIQNRYSTRFVENLLVTNSGIQSIPAYAFTKIQFNGGPQFGGDSFLEWDATNNVAKIRSPGTYLITGQFEFAGWAANASTWGQIRIQTDAGYTYSGGKGTSFAAGDGIILQVQVQMNLLRGQSVWLEVIQVQGSSQNSSGSNSRLNVTKIC